MRPRDRTVLEATAIGATTGLAVTTVSALAVGWVAGASPGRAGLALAGVASLAVATALGRLVGGWSFALRAAATVAFAACAVVGTALSPHAIEGVSPLVGALAALLGGAAWLRPARAPVRSDAPA